MVIKILVSHTKSHKIFAAALFRVHVVRNYGKNTIQKVSRIIEWKGETVIVVTADAKTVFFQSIVVSESFLDFQAFQTKVDFVVTESYQWHLRKNDSRVIRRSHLTQKSCNQIYGSERNFKRSLYVSDCCFLSFLGRRLIRRRFKLWRLTLFWPRL